MDYSAIFRVNGKRGINLHDELVKFVSDLEAKTLLENLTISKF